MPERSSQKYVTVLKKEHNRQAGGLVRFFNPDSKVNIFPLEALRKIFQAPDEIEADSTLSFIVCAGASVGW